MGRKIVYIVTAHGRASLNERVRKLLLLRGYFARLVLVCAGERTRMADELWEIKHTTNPTGILRKLGLGRLKGAIDRWLYFPSPQVLFVRAVYGRLKSSIASDLEQGCQVTLVTCVPHHALCLLGLKLKQEYSNLRWIMDWQDLWSYDTYYLHRVPLFYRNRLRRLEKRAFATCDMNVTTNPFAKRVLEQQYQVSAKCVRSIYHPFSDDDITDSDQKVKPYTREPGQPVRIVFLGNLFKPPKVPGDKVLEAINCIRERGIDVELHLFGNPPRDCIDKLVSSGVVLRGYLDNTEIISNIRQCDFLLLVLADLPNCRTIMHAKLPQYLLAGRPIIAIAPEFSAVAEIVKETRSGYVIPAGEEWGQGVYDVLQSYLGGASVLSRDEVAIQQFNWANVSKQWLEIL